MSCYQMLLLNAGVARSACIRQTQCVCSVVAHDVAGAVLDLLNEDAPGSVHKDNERRVYIAIQVSPPPPSRRAPLFADLPVWRRDIGPNTPGRGRCLSQCAIREGFDSTTVCRTNGSSTCWTTNDSSASRPLDTNSIVPLEPGSLLEVLLGKTLGICTADENGTHFACVAFI